MKKVVLIFITTFILTAILLNIGPLYRWVNYSLRGNEKDLPQAQTPLAQNNSSNPATKNNGASETKNDNAILVIPSLNISAPIVFSKSKKEADLQKDLEKGVVLYPGSVNPEENGTMVIIGHSSSYPWYKGSYGSIFSLIEKLKAGDKITIIYNNKNYEYIVKNQIKVASQSVQLLQMQNSDLVLMSCWPVGTNSIRIAVSADLKNKY
jgi:LPXTG-site transpeptidase (sortase) family protein